MLMERIHSAATGTVAKVIFGLICVSFLLSGVAGYVMYAPKNFAAKVNGVEISQQLFSQKYNEKYQQMSAQLGERFAVLSDTPNFTQTLRNQVLDNLINQELFQQYINDLKLKVSDAQVERAIVTSPEFQRDGKFDNKLYQQTLNANHLNPDAYAGYVREYLVVSQLQNALIGSDFIVPAQLQILEKSLFQARDVRLATLPSAQVIAQQQVTEDEIQAYYDSHKSAFIAPEQVKVQYVDLSLANIAQQVKVTDVELAQYYQDNKGLFGSDHLAHIQVATEQEANEVYQALQNGADFAELAKNRSMDKPSAVNGGDLNWVVAGMMPLAFEKAVSTLSVGQYSQPVKVDNAFHIIKLIERKAQPFEQVKGQIEQKIRQELAESQFYKLDKIANEKAFENQDSLAAVANATGLKLQETDYFSRQDVPSALNFQNVVSGIFDSNLTQGGVNSEPINVGELHSIVFRVLEHKDEGAVPLSEVKNSIADLLKHQKADVILQEQGQKLAQQLNENNSQTLPENVKFSDSEHLVYAENKYRALNDSIFAMPKNQGKPVYQAAKNARDEIVIIELNKVTDGQLNAEQLKQFALQVGDMNKVVMLDHLLASLRGKAKIEVNQDFLAQNQSE